VPFLELLSGPHVGILFILYAYLAVEGKVGRRGNQLLANSLALLWWKPIGSPFWPDTLVT
jgi:hypothetical protein